jgi:hypothetical protein
MIAQPALTDDAVVLGSRSSSGAPPVGAVTPPAAVLVDEGLEHAAPASNHQDGATPPHPDPNGRSEPKVTGPVEAPPSPPGHGSAGPESKAMEAVGGRRT